MFCCWTRCWVGLIEIAQTLPDFFVNLATGGSAIKAVEVLTEHQVPEDRIIFVNLVSGS